MYSFVLPHTVENQDENWISKADWDEVLKDYKGGVDYPISLFWKDLMKQYPEAKVSILRTNVQRPWLTQM